MKTHSFDHWLYGYAMLALRIDKLLAATGGSMLIYDGPAQWHAEVGAEEPTPPSQLVEGCDALLRDLPFDGHRAAYVAAQINAMRAVAGHLDGADVPFLEYAQQCLGMPIGPESEDTFAAAHTQLDAALPRGPGSLAERLHAWHRAHIVPADRLPELARLAITETIGRTREFVALPDELHVDVQLQPGPHRGQYVGDSCGVIYLSDSEPFNGADLLYVVAHEGFPGHITESLLKDVHLTDRPEHKIRFLVSPPFVLSEGLGLHAQDTAFPGDGAQRWLTDHVLAPLGIAADGSDFAAIHNARTVLWGAWGNAALLAAEDRPGAEIADYLDRWALLTEQQMAWALSSVRSAGMAVYLLGYFHGWRLLRPWLDHPDRRERTRRLLTEPLLPADLA